MNATAARWLNKVPEVTLSFWVIKILSTTVGETGADYLAVDAGFGAGWTSLGMAALLAIALFWQMRTKAYTPWIYWLTVVLVSIVGTQITDILTDKLDVSLYTSTAIFSVLLGLNFVVWFRTERSLSIRAIVTPRREWFYWTTVLCTFALGTAAGDLATVDSAELITAAHIARAVERSKSAEEQIKDRYGSYTKGLGTDISSAQKEKSPYYFWNETKDSMFH